MSTMDYQMFDQELDQEQASGRIIRIGKRRYVANMAWRAIENPSNAAKEAREIAKSERMNLMMIYQGFVAQAGLAYAPKGQIKLYRSAYSVAAVLSSVLGESWLGVFALDDGNYLLVAVKDGAIIPGFDLVGDPQAIREKALSVRRAHKWATVYLPEDDENLNDEFSSLETTPSNLTGFLDQAKHSRIFKLEQTTGGAIGPVTLVALCVLVAAGAGGVYYTQFLNKRPVGPSASELASRAKDLAQRKESARQEIKQATANPDWIDQPLPLQLIRNCQVVLGQLPTRLIDWPLKEIDCRATAITGVYERPAAGATMAQAVSASGQFPISGVQASKATLGFKLDRPSARDHGSTVLNDIEWMRQWVSFFQKFERSEAAQLEVQPKPHPQPPPPKATWVKLLGENEARIEPPWWLTYEWTMTLAGLDPVEIFSQLPDQGLVLRSATGAINEATGRIDWKLQGVVNTRP